MRMKYPQIVDAAISSSAPLLLFDNPVNSENFFNIVTQNFQTTLAVSDCSKFIQEGFKRLENYIKNPSEKIFETISQAFKVLFY